jgi:hypothetical protein
MSVIDPAGFLLAAGVGGFLPGKDVSLQPARSAAPTQSTRRQ